MVWNQPSILWCNQCATCQSEVLWGKLFVKCGLLNSPTPFLIVIADVLPQHRCVSRCPSACKNLGSLAVFTQVHHTPDLHLTKSLLLQPTQSAKCLLSPLFTAAHVHMTGSALQWGTISCAGTDWGLEALLLGHGHGAPVARSVFYVWDMHTLAEAFFLVTAFKGHMSQAMALLSPPSRVQLSTMTVYI